ncbi:MULTISPECIES: hypothetical protein [Paraburkholderia]|nr:hypothetical protein BWU74_27140 [Burkholderia sp. Bk]CAE6825545.1 hypothetical protein R75483_06456 [Paraburkholderia domus]
MSYPPCFQRLHDEPGPVGYLGRGTHYSVLRVPTWHDDLMNQIQYGRFLDFAIIWDEDHDDRVLDAILIMYLTGLLAPVRFIGERKGVLSVLLAPATVKTWDDDTFQQYCEDVVDICAQLDDPWTAEINSMDSTQHSIIQAPAENVATYLKNIDMLWQLGTRSTLPA